MSTPTDAENIEESESRKNGLWGFLPRHVLVQVFKHLKCNEVVVFGLVCRHWLAVSMDNVLWKFLFLRDFKPRRSPNLSVMDWKEEYVRLRDSVPKVLIQTLTAHTDEVLHVTFSHDGRQIVSCSKDHKVIVWDQESKGKFREHFSYDMSRFDWMHTWAAQFSPGDTKLMVAGVVNQVGGELAIFKTGRGTTEEYIFVCRVVNDPYDMLGCWLNEHYFLSGTLSDHFVHSETCIWMCSAESVQDAAQDESQADAEVPQGVNLGAYKFQLFRFKNFEDVMNVRYIQNHNRKNFKGDAAIKWKPLSENELSDTVQQIDEEGTSLVEENAFCLIFLCGNKTLIPHQLGFQRITSDLMRNPPSRTDPEHVIDFEGHVIGFAICHEKELLYVNVRAWPDNSVPNMEEPPPIDQYIEMHVVDLKTLQRTGEVLRGHRGYTPSGGAFYLYIDVSANLVGSGSEDLKSYVWDRRYGCVVSTLPHDKCVNCIAFNPHDEETCVTASDDNTLRVWTSRRILRQH